MGDKESSRTMVQRRKKYHRKPINPEQELGETNEPSVAAMPGISQSKTGKNNWTNEMAVVKDDNFSSNLSTEFREEVMNTNDLAFCTEKVMPVDVHNQSVKAGWKKSENANNVEHSGALRQEARKIRDEAISNVHQLNSEASDVKDISSMSQNSKYLASKTSAASRESSSAVGYKGCHLVSNETRSKRHKQQLKSMKFGTSSTIFQAKPVSESQAEKNRPKQACAENNPATQKHGNSNKKSLLGLKKIMPMEKPFEDYWCKEDVELGFKRGELIQGVLRINPRNHEECYITHPDGKSDVCISGLHDRNRALNGDIVCVLIYPKEKWKALIEDLNEREGILVEAFNSTLTLESSIAGLGQNEGKVDESNTSSGVKPWQQTGTLNEFHDKSQTATNLISRQRQAGSRYTLLKDIGINQSDVSVPISPVIKDLFADSGTNSVQSIGELKCLNQKIGMLPEDFLVRTGKVVYIAEKVHSRVCVGRIRPITDKKHPDLAFFSPSDSRLPRILVNLSDCPEGFCQRPEDFQSTLFIARLTDWEKFMPFARGCLVRSLGEAGEIEPETEGMLIEYELDFGDFTEDVLSCLPKLLPWTIPASEYEYRRDLREQCICTIDPVSARDLDDALSCREVETGIYEVGVHIADVSFFVKPETSLDCEAAKRCTSVYLVQKVVPMLPRLLSEELCSLNAGEDRLCFSVIWKMNKEGEILDEVFERTVIKSCVKLSYEHAQGFINEPGRIWTSKELPPIHGSYSIKEIHDVVLNLNRIAKSLRKKRFDGGALRLDQVKLQFTLCKETGLPSGWYMYEQQDSNRLVEEFMLLANMAVAHRIKAAYPEFAVLRRHPPPQIKMLENVISVCQNLGIDIDASSAGALQKSLYQNFASDNDAKARLQVLVSLCSKPMQHARYFCTGTLDNEEDYVHYALNVPLYTHFTSPIRRYPDIMVHRLLSAAVGYSKLNAVDCKVIEKQCTLCNSRKTASKRVSEMSAELFFGIFLKQCGPFEEKGMVMSVLDKSFDVLVLNLGIVKRAYCEKLPLQSFKFCKIKKRPQLNLLWKADDDHLTEIEHEITLFTPVVCRLIPGDDAIRWTLEIKHPLDPFL